MKFRFCGDLDCPDWALAAISLLTKLTSIKMRQLAQEVAKTLLEMSEASEAAGKICQDAKLSLEDSKIVIAAVEFFLSSAVKYNVSAEVFSNELQQLGFPKEHAASLSKVYQSTPQFAQVFLQGGFRISRLTELKWRPEMNLRSPSEQEATDFRIAVSMKLEKDGHLRSHVFSMSLEKMLILKHEISEILHIMDSLPKVPSV
ncbi:COMM domain-containing protein 4-like isoform X2 [Paramacrobiotus metropolitanus]|uniref:COMM domain-containing protein 4-like isoform X2 n=1 Tax=Paramacrobiotus metropolitanus TaxID=2943436 RepID=UPI002445CC33|nr:COMM domain-containing protein 4-like isoform X2 [Paramacrobiotus metropolitanus]XP_055337202.1 COMM domain-containing protein 4-like isoform X2 [Paramacrobiotus metropolitanus]XP_055337203.1 COMM domain-containing protein 4-like isoform X2 [Paramacrobiotus metropolitanus]